MSVTVEELLAQHERCLRAKEELKEVEITYPETPYQSPNNPFLDSAIAKVSAEGKKMKELMAQAAPAVLAEAREKATRS